ncbi:cytosine permease [Heyndrickxia oleronia]|jgi:cytosine permease|uniref:cytosine permease n=1 Tax=Heyndrickxia oleronia TaxID=38875 RepID=UPI00090422B0|nr:cytosine permease [Heyndrickxia oleronia]OJH16667.1 cytosine permease [Bacillus obstructivus]MCI1591501.1 cytosine permease [Heyndrickxia oleronia]MCI1614363.1 cytosine permease [Heyndrickxia oleronia]MCI1745437.1 cytosine permease [Heyndrickxia oleronia]MCI1762244.1 cytosine permease [Heyndrickxia oleronia]
MRNNGEHQSWYSLGIVWAGAMISIPSLLVGNTLISGMSLPKALFVAFVGYFIVVAIMILQGMQSSDLGKPTVHIAGQVFGKKGSRTILSIILAIACLGWFGIQANVCGAALANLLANYDMNMPIPLASFLCGLVMVVSAIYGIKVLRVISYIAVPLLVIISIVGLVQTLSGDHLQAIQNYKPSGNMSFMDGLSVTMGSFALGAVIAGDYSQFSKKRSDVFKAAIFGIIPAGVLMIGVGAVLTIAYQTSDITAVFLNIATPFIGGVILILATWKTNLVNAISGGIALINVFNISKQKEKMAVGIAGTVGTLLAVVGILNYFTPIMSILSAMIPPVAGVMIASYWIMNKGNMNNWRQVEGVNRLGVFSWLVGAVIASIPVVFSLFPSLPQVPNQPLTGIIISFVIYYFGYRFSIQKSIMLEENK